MKKMFSLLVFVMLAAAVLSGCNKGSDNILVSPVDPNPVLGTLITSPTVSPITSFSQSIVSQDTGTLNGSHDSFPGQANVWDIGMDFSLDDGNDDQFDGALIMTVGASVFPWDQTYGELTFYTPLMGSGNGVKVATVSDGVAVNMAPLQGAYSAFLSATSDSRLQQTVNVPAGATAPVMLYWRDQVNLDAAHIPGYVPSYQVVVRDLAGNELVSLYTTTVDAGVSPWADLTAYTGQTIVLSFEQHNMSRGDDGSPPWIGAMIDEVSVRDNNGTGTELVVNGDFEAGNLTGWTTNSPTEVQNMTSGQRYLDNLNVTRSFYTVPNKLWGRWVDVFENPDLVSAATTTVTYYTNLGSDDCGVIYDTPGTSGQAITSWDTTWSDRDISMVFGLASSKTYTSTTVLSLPGSSVACTGSQDIYVDYVITVPAGGKVAIVNFIIMGSHDTGLTAADTSARATEVDAEAARIVNDFWADGQYRTGMTQEQIDAIANF